MSSLHNIRNDHPYDKTANCPICQEPLNYNLRDRKITTLFCKHSYHEKCRSEYIEHDGKTCALHAKEIYPCRQTQSEGIIGEYQSLIEKRAYSFRQIGVILGVGFIFFLSIWVIDTCARRQI